MKYGAPFRINVYTWVGDMQFGSPEEAIELPAGNGMRENDVLAQLRNLTQKRCQSALNTGLQNSIFTMGNCFQWFDPHLQYFANYIFRQHNDFSNEMYQGEKYLYGEGVYSLSIGDEKKNPDYVVLVVRCRDLSYSK